MKHRLLIPILAAAAILASGCATNSPSAAQISAIAQPLADAALTAGAAYEGVSPTTTQAAVTAFNSLWGAYAQAQAGQPVDAGAVSQSVGAAIASAIPAGTSQNKTLAALQAAANSLASQAKAASVSTPAPAASSAAAHRPSGRLAGPVVLLHRDDD